jgi:hypothetical protein
MFLSFPALIGKAEGEASVFISVEAPLSRSGSDGYIRRVCRLVSGD